MAELSNLERSFDEIKNKSRASAPNPWLDPKFNRIDPWGKEIGIRVDDIPERLGLIQQGQALDLMGNDFIDLGDTPSNYGKNGQFVMTDGSGSLSYDWPYWIKIGQNIYYKKGNVGVGLARPVVKFHTYGDNILDGAVTINESGRDKDFRVEGSSEVNLLFCDASTDRVAIGLNAPVCRAHIRGAICGDYAGLHPDTYLLIENNDNVGIQLQACTTGSAYIVFADDKYNPPAGRITYSFNLDEINFVIGRNVLVYFKTTGAVFVQNELEIDSTGVAYFTADAHNADAYFALEEDNAIKWTLGFDYSDSQKFQISAGIPGTSVAFEIETGLINLYLDVGIQGSQDLRFYGNDDYYVGFKVPSALLANQIWLLPTADADAANKCLKSDGSGNLGWSQALGIGDNPTFATLFLASIKSGADQGAAGAAAGELWKTASHATLLDNIVMIGV